MRPVVSVEEMKAFDAKALTVTSHETLVRRAGSAVGYAAIVFLGGVSGKRITVIAGPGSNGADGRIAASLLRRRGAKVRLLGPTATSAEILPADLVIDAAYGTGLSRSFHAAFVPDSVPVIAVDLPSGLDGDKGSTLGTPLEASMTVTMAAMKSGLLLGDGPSLCGEITVADIGIPTEPHTMELMEQRDLHLLAPRARTDNKWSAAVTVVAGSPGMEGAAALCSMGALRAGSGMVRLVTRATDTGTPWPEDIVRREVNGAEFVDVVLSESSRAKAVVIGPGLGLDENTRQATRELMRRRSCPMVVDADAITAIGSRENLKELVCASSHPLLITPHDGELKRLLGRDLDADRLGELRELVASTGVCVLSKGATTVIVAPDDLDPMVRFVTAGTPALATAGTGDVLSGVIAAFCARGLSLPLAAALGAFVHGSAGALGSGTMVATDLPNLVGEVIKEEQA